MGLLRGFREYVLERPIRLLPDLRSAYLRLGVLGLCLGVITPGWGRPMFLLVGAWELYDWWRVRSVMKQLDEGRYRVDIGADHRLAQNRLVSQVLNALAVLTLAGVMLGVLALMVYGSAATLGLGGAFLLAGGSIGVGGLMCWAIVRLVRVSWL